MALADTGKAIGAVSQLLRTQLTSVGVGNVTVGRLEGTGVDNPRLNLFLYEIQLDPNFRNQSLDEGQPAPLWLVLKYLLTAFDEAGESDSIEAHGFLGEGMRALQELAFLPLVNSSSPLNVISALNDNPEVLKITFDQTSSDLLSKLMQGTDEKYRCSVGFEVRPVMIVPVEPPSYSLLVGINYETNTVIGEDGIQVVVLPSMGSAISAIAPEKFEVNPDPNLTTLTIQGSDLHLSGLVVRLSTVELPVTAQRPDTLQCQVSSDLRNGRLISAGNHPISVIQTLPTERRRSSNLLVVGLLPSLESATVVPGSVTPVPAIPPAPAKVTATINLAGALLGTEEDDVFVALYRDGRAVQTFDQLTSIPSPPPPPPTPLQTNLQLVIPERQAVLPGTYRLILRVNGQQARNSPVITL